MTEHRIDPPRHEAMGQALLPRPGTPVPGAIIATTAGALVVLTLGSGLAGAGAVLWALTAFCAGALLMLAGLDRGYPHPQFGPANTVTLLRMSLVAVLLAVVLGGTGGTWAVVILAVTALALDGVDGWLARRTRRVSRFGERFDMEVDCLFAVALTLIVLGQGKVGPWILLLAVPRYVFWAASLRLPWLARPLPPRASRKVVCVVQLGVLILLVTPVVGVQAATMLAAAAVVAVAASFFSDVRHLWRNR
jgi:phosphatidylglycerophosphate synthase